MTGRCTPRTRLSGQTARKLPHTGAAICRQSGARLMRIRLYSVPPGFYSHGA